MRHVTCNIPHMDFPQAPVSPRIGDWVYEQMREAIFDHRLKPGDRLSVPAFAARFGASRSPVREAVQRLVHQGLAEEVKNKGAIVASLSPGDLAAMYQVRLVLEVLAGQLAVERCTTQDLNNLEATLATHTEAVASHDVSTFMEADAQFHRQIRESTGNKLLQEFLDLLQERIRIAMHSTSVTVGPEASLKEHEAILKALKERDAAGVAESTRNHIHRLMNTLEKTPAVIVEASGPEELST